MAKDKETTRKKLYTEEGYKSLVDEYEYLKTSAVRRLRTHSRKRVPMETCLKTANMMRLKTSKRKLKPE